MTARYDWTINQGETSELTIKRATDGGAYNSSTAFMTHFRMQVKDKAGGTAVLSLSADGSGSNTVPFNRYPAGNDGSGGGATEAEQNSEVKITITAAETAAIAAGKYVYDVENHDNAGTVSRILEGSFIVKAEVTTNA